VGRRSVTDHIVWIRRSTTRHGVVNTLFVELPGHMPKPRARHSIQRHREGTMNSG
jgi:hypothetical protein